MNNLKISLYGLFDICMQLYDFAINNGIDLASTVDLTLTEGRADIYITVANGSRPPFKFTGKT